MVAIVMIGTVVLAALSTLTAVGAHHRGRGLAFAAVAGICFPITWTVWYLRDEHPYRRTTHQV